MRARRQPRAAGTDAARNRPGNTSAKAALAAGLAAVAVTTVLLVAGATREQRPAPAPTATAPAPALLQPRQDNVPSEILVDPGAEITYGAIWLTNTFEQPITVLNVTARTANPSDVVISDIVVADPVPAEPTTLEHGWPPKNYLPGSFHAPADYALIPGASAQILVRLSRPGSNPVEIAGFDITYQVGARTLTESTDQTLQLN